jgi:hypothetical protein
MDSRIKTMFLALLLLRLLSGCARKPVTGEQRFVMVIT